jgi:probable rRNA maturation factor
MTGAASGGPGDAVVICSDARSAGEASGVLIDVDRWERLARTSLVSEGAVGELTLTFIDRDEIAALNAEHMGADGATDVLSFPLDDAGVPPGVPTLLGDVVISPAVAASQAPQHAGELDDELALLVVHGVLHILGHDHAEADEASAMRAREVALLEAHHWGHAAPDGFRQTHPAS